MPNNCDNTLLVSGRRFELELFAIDHLCEVEPDGELLLDLNTVFPYPERFRRLDDYAEAWKEAHAGEMSAGPEPADGYGQGGEEWCVANWGTKWNTYNGTPSDFTDLNDTTSRLGVHFFTAWSPLSKRLLRELSRRHPSLEFDYSFADADSSPRRGRICLRQGRIIKEQPGFRRR